MSSGFVYFSAVLLLIYLSYINFKNINKQGFKLLFLSLTCISVLISSLINYNIGFSFFELIQFFVVCSLFFFVRSDLIRNEDFKSIPIGFFLGSVILSIAIIYRQFILNDLSQENFEFFSISQTFNYTAYYMIFGLVFAPFIILKSFFLRLLSFVFFSISIFYLQSRAGILIGSLVFVYLSLNSKSLIKLFSGLSLFGIIFYFLIDSPLFDSSNQNDLIFSIYNFENNFSNLERLKMFLGSFENIENHPFGLGIDNTNIGLQALGFNYPHSHNTLSNWIYDFGYLGIALYSFFIFFLFRVFLKSRKLKNEVKKINYSLIVYLVCFSMLSSLQYNILVTLITYFSILTLISSNKIEKNLNSQDI